ncbi:MAG: hypothetical protein ACRC14_00770, partial [Paracoccaceae bacterium]
MSTTSGPRALLWKTRSDRIPASVSDERVRQIRIRFNTHDKANLSWMLICKRKRSGAAPKALIMRSMVKKHLSVTGDLEDQRPGPFDPDPDAEPDLWFLSDQQTEAEPDCPPGPKAERARLFDPNIWQAAEGRHSGALAELAALFGALDERLRAGSPAQRDGWRHRLALLEVVDLGWWTGKRVPMDQLALWVGLRIGATGEDAQSV